MRELFAISSAKIPNLKGAKADLETAEEVAELLADDQRIFIANHVRWHNYYIIPFFLNTSGYHRLVAMLDSNRLKTARRLVY